MPRLMMAVLVPLLVTLSLWLVAVPGYAAVTESREFETAAQAELYYELIDELRCPKCQNQTIGDSNAPLAKDLRDRTYTMVMNGQSKQEIIAFMVARYGDFAHYQPPVRWSTSVLWWGPLLFIGGGIAVVLWRVRERAAPAAAESAAGPVPSARPESELTEAERAALAELLQDHEPDNQPASSNINGTESKHD